VNDDRRSRIAHGRDVSMPHVSVREREACGLAVWRCGSFIACNKGVNDMPKATLHRMELPKYTCSYGIAARDLLRKEGFEIEEHILRSRPAVDDFKDKHHIATTPLIFIDGKKIGGFTELRAHLKASKRK
jgi:glutaredoxin